MNYYPRLSEWCLWTVCDADDPEKKITVQDEAQRVSLKTVQYDPLVYAHILEQSAGYVLVEKGILKTSDKTEDLRREKKLEAPWLIVKERKFVGILTLCTEELEAYLHTSQRKEYKGILFTNGDAVGRNYDELHRCPGYWVYAAEYSLEQKY